MNGIRFSQFQFELHFSVKSEANVINYIGTAFHWWSLMIAKIVFFPLLFSISSPGRARSVPMHSIYFALVCYISCLNGFRFPFVFLIIQIELISLSSDKRRLHLLTIRYYMKYWKMISFFCCCRFLRNECMVISKKILIKELCIKPSKRFLIWT